MQVRGAKPQLIVLVAESQALPGMWLEDILTDAGCGVSGPYATCRDAIESLDAAPPDFALVSVNLRQGPCFALAHELRRRGIPFALIAGSVPVPPTFSDVPVLDRLFCEEDVVRAVPIYAGSARVMRRMLARDAVTIRLAHEPGCFRHRSASGMRGAGANAGFRLSAVG
ncbi:hypothetical protein M446_1555 [Methylobacterium sp. 4-46]|uniref:hypothetical protein n=1 Tax=unclassified Methylobacterium TaxID=2615210 RepID=UPI000152D52F|nr:MULTISPECIES: hypothetical protein [Methylobacterium]ACA16056.1 hypothetical protein M446_1555 [Methylobacterium sp. 4-46]WFT81768.1 hypothetical protein QA634_07880 [Methylobacterium nodulans]